MSRLGLSLAVVLCALSIATAQLPSSGILYWCSLCEQGPNMDPAATPCIPRWVVGACHDRLHQKCSGQRL
jgi:hypothetical protein